MRTNEELKRVANLLIVRTGVDGGMGEIFRFGKRYGSVIWSNGGGWEHVSVAPYNRRITPSWDDMCVLKDMFFREDETVVQYHPAKSEYVNNMPNCLHLWRPINAELPTPPAIMVGVKKGQTAAEVRNAITQAGLSAHGFNAQYRQLMILPCAVGDPIYWIDGDNNNEIVELVVKEFSYNKDGILCRAEYVDEKVTQIFDLLEFEKVVFTDRKKAAAKVDVADADVEKTKVCADEKNNN